MRSAFFAICCFLLAAPAGAYTIVGFAWDTERGPVDYTFHEAGSDDIGDESEWDALRQAFDGWGCIENTSLRFIETADRTNTPAVQDNKVNEIYWAESESEVRGYGMQDVNLAITMNNAVLDQGLIVLNTETDIIFNGFDTQWNTSGQMLEGNIDVFTISLAQVGQMTGLGLACESPDDPNCPDLSQTVMGPVYANAADGPRADDALGIQELYPATDGSKCGGPYRQGERCQDNCECVDEMRCVPDVNGDNVCAPLCDSEDATCPMQFSCILAAKDENGLAKGTCMRLNKDFKAPPAGTCQIDDNCQVGTCLAVSVIGRSVCRKSCEGAGDCPDNHKCTEGVCTGPGELEGIACAEDQLGCACEQSNRSNLPVALIFSLVLLVPGLGRKRR